MHAGKLVLSAGRTRIAIAYDAVGMRSGFEGVGGDDFVTMWQGQTRAFVTDPRARPPNPPIYPLLLRADLNRDGHPIDELADWIAALDPSADTVARLFAPAPLPLGSQAILLRAHESASVLLWNRLVPDGARWLAQDGWCGRAFTSGATRDEAVRGLQAELWRVKPRLLGTPGGDALPFVLPVVDPAPTSDAPLRFPTPPRSPEDGGPTTVFSQTMSISFGGFVSRHEWPTPDPAHAPIVLMRIPPPPVVPDRFANAGFRPVAVIGERGVIGWLLRRDDHDGWTLVGEGIMDLVDPLELDDEIDAAERAYAEDWREILPEGWHGQARPLFASWTLWDNEKQARGSLRFGGSAAGSFHPQQLDPAKAAWTITRIRI